MRKSKDPLGYFTLKLTDEDYARVSTAAAVRGVSVGEVLRRFIRALPDVTPEEVSRWRAYRKRGGSEKVTYGLEQSEQIAGGLEAATEKAMTEMTSMKNMREEWEQIAAEERRKDLAALIKRPLNVSAFDLLNRPEGSTPAVEGTELPVLGVAKPSALQLAELEQAAEEGDEQAKEALRLVKEKYGDKKERTEL